MFTLWTLSKQGLSDFACFHNHYRASPVYARLGDLDLISRSQRCQNVRRCISVGSRLVWQSFLWEWHTLRDNTQYVSYDCCGYLREIIDIFLDPTKFCIWALFLGGWGGGGGNLYSENCCWALLIHTSFGDQDQISTLSQLQHKDGMIFVLIHWFSFLKWKAS